MIRGGLLLTLGISLAGVELFRLLALPLPWLLGPMFGCLAAALAGLNLRGAPLVSNAMRTVLGVAVGASVTPALFARLPEMAASLALVPLLVLAIGATGYPFFRRIMGFDPATSYYAAMPGGLQDMLVFGEEAGGDPRALSLIHATRVLLIVSVLPLVLSQGLGLTLDARPGLPLSDIPTPELLAMTVAALGGWFIAQSVGLFGAAILGPLILAAAASLSGVITHRPPAESILAAQFFIGFGVGVKYVGVSWQELRRIVLAGAAYTAAIFVVALVFAVAVIALGLAPVTEALLAFSPGGQAEMAVLALVAGADLAFVVTHHILRILIVILGAPLFARVLARRNRP